MGIKEAIEQLKWYFENDDGGAAENKTKKAAYMAISALEKQEGKKPNNRSGWPNGGRDTADGNCPVCGSPLVCTTPRYCSKHEYYCRDCGQRIDWSE